MIACKAGCRTSPVLIMTMAEQPLRIAAMADLHFGKHSRGTLHDLFAEISANADVLLLCGDLTDYGLAEEAEELVADIRAGVRVPIIAVLGNHDFESGQADLVRSVLERAGVPCWMANAPKSAGLASPVFAGLAGVLAGAC